MTRCHRYPSCDCALPTLCRHRVVRPIAADMTLGRLARLVDATEAEVEVERTPCGVRFVLVTRAHVEEVRHG